MQRKESLKIVHTLPGRVRFQFKAEEAAPNLDDFLKIPGVKELTFNKITKTLLIVYDEQKLDLEKLISQIQERMPGFRISRSQNYENNASLEAKSDDLLSELIHNVAAGANRNVALQTKGLADLTSILPSALFLLGTEEMIRRPVMPRWYDFWWFSYNIFWQNYTYKHPK